MSKNLFTLTALAVTILAIPAVAADVPKGYLQVPGVDTAIQFYGNACFDMVYDGVQHGGVMAGLSAASVTSPDKGQPKNVWDTTMDESRFGMRTITPSSYGDIKTRFEMDFLGTNKDSEANTITSGSTKNYAHLRQMYGEWNGFLAGKTDSNFEDPDGSPNYIDWDGLLADWYGNSRVGQLRYTANLDPKTVLSFAIEQNSSLNLGNGGGTELPGSLTGRVQYADTWGHISFAGAFSRYSKFVNTYVAATASTPAVAGGTSKESKNSFSWALAGHFQFGDDSVVYHVGIGDGQNGAGLQDGVNKTTMELVQARQAEVGYEHFWTPAVHTNVFGSYVGYQRDVDKGMTGSAFKTYIQAGANVMWDLTRTMRYAVEYMYGVAKTFDKDTIINPDLSTTDAVHESKLHFQFKYKFN